MAKTLNPLDSMLLGDRVANLADRVRMADDFAPNMGVEIRWPFKIDGKSYLMRVSALPDEQ